MRCNRLSDFSSVFQEFIFSCVNYCEEEKQLGLWYMIIVSNFPQLHRWLSDNFWKGGLSAEFMLSFHMSVVSSSRFILLLLGSAQRRVRGQWAGNVLLLSGSWKKWTGPHGHFSSSLRLDVFHIIRPVGVDVQMDPSVFSAVTSDYLVSSETGPWENEVKSKVHPSRNVIKLVNDESRCRLL